MYSINLISSINNSYYPNFKQKQEVQRATNPITTVPMNGLDAMANYNTALINKQNEAPKYIHQSLEEHLSSLKSSKPSNIDYTIETYEPDRCFLNIKDKNGNITDRIEYRDGKFVGCEINTYQGDKLIKRIGRGKDRIETSEKIFYRDKYPQEKFTIHGMNYETTPEQFIEYLERNNIKYKVEYVGEEDNNRSVLLDEYDRNGKAVRSYWWCYGENKFNEDFFWTAVSELNENQEEVRRISFDKEKTEVCDYNYLTKTKEYNNSQYDIKTLTNAGITYNTTPQEYIEYLKLNNIKYKIKEYPEFTKNIEIDEINNNGDVVTRTSWIKAGNGNNLERICRFEMSDFGRKRFDFYPDKTYIMASRYIN